MRNGSASPTWVRSQRWGQSEGLAALGKYAFWGQSQGGAPCMGWADGSFTRGAVQTQHCAWEEEGLQRPGDKSGASWAGEDGIRQQPGRLGWWESRGRREGAEVSRPGVSATHLVVSHSHHTWRWAGLWCYCKTTGVDRGPRSTGAPWTKQQNAARQYY